MSRHRLEKLGEGEVGGRGEGLQVIVGHGSHLLRESLGVMPVDGRAGRKSSHPVAAGEAYEPLQQHRHVLWRGRTDEFCARWTSRLTWVTDFSHGRRRTITR